MLQHPPRSGKRRDWYAIGSAIRALLLLALTAVDDWVSAVTGIRPIRWHARRAADVARQAWWLALYGPPAEPGPDGIYDAEVVDDEKKEGGR
ncbi:hypothetical protein Ssi03_45960 [Sphaerisporangium siamense]|uniref:Uncharacterized protein n=1 Tax=Sphaerisporangium siamense TaxID=795645 RepID=A0A7W7D2T2_9ACTN|nr:hypothetical protein [Sphaerisporangium siamense]MBB4699269.1 hypothetical protein [Sphaerisporangium siamense]GII86606.1 hypothetical protein Ssi03_45960 [Sphaerisporangium siamense]